MRIAVLGSASSWYVGDLRRAAADPHEIVPVTYRQLAAHVESRNNTKSLSPFHEGATGSASATLTNEATLAEPAAPETSDKDSSGLRLASGEYDLCRFDALLVRSMPPGSLEQVIFRMNALAQLAEAGVRVVNPPRAIEIAVDKYLTTVKLQQAGLLVPRTAACQTWEQAIESFERLGGDVVVKPLFGGEGRGITRVRLHDDTRLTDEAIAQRVFKTLEQIGAVIYLQEFIPHEGCDLRVLLVGDQTLGMRRRHPVDWRTNISRGAQAEPLEVTDELESLARTASEAVGTTIAGVDILPGKDGRLYALEVNAVPGWRALSHVTGVDVAKLVLSHLQQR